MSCVPNNALEWSLFMGAITVYFAGGFIACGFSIGAVLSRAKPWIAIPVSIFVVAQSWFLISLVFSDSSHLPTLVIVNSVLSVIAMLTICWFWIRYFRMRRH